MNIPAEYTMAIVIAFAVVGVASLVALELAIDRYERWKQNYLRRHVCPYCGCAVIVRNYGKGVRARVCLNGVCGAKWRVR